MKLNNKIKLLALDVDGTLFDDAGHIPEQNIRAIQKTQEAGVTVVVAPAEIMTECHTTS